MDDNQPVMQQTNTIQGTYERSKADNLGISKNFIRQSCLDGKLKHCRAGNKILIYYPNLLDLIQNGDQPAQLEPSIYGKVRRLG